MSPALAPGLISVICTLAAAIRAVGSKLRTPGADGGLSKGMKAKLKAGALPTSWSHGTTLWLTSRCSMMKSVPSAA